MLLDHMPRLVTATLNIHTAHSHYALQVNESNAAVLVAVTGTFAGERHRASTTIDVPRLHAADYSVRPAWFLARIGDFDRANLMMRGLVGNTIAFHTMSWDGDPGTITTTRVQRVEWSV